MNSVDVFAAVAGPGSFTGLRVGLTAVKGWAEVYGKPIAAISGLEAIAAQASGHQEVICPFLDARRGHVFGSTYRREPSKPGILQLQGEEAILTIEEFLSQVRQNCRGGQVVLVSATPEVLPHDLVESFVPGAQIEQVSASLAPTIGRLASDRAKRGELVDALGLDANYIRRSGADGRVMSAGGEESRGSSGVSVRTLATTDVPAILEILRESPEASGWSRHALLQMTSAGGPSMWVAERDGVVAGLLIGRSAADEFEIMNMAVSVAHRRQGIGSRLLETALDFSRKGGGARVYLEVRASNAPAIALYKLQGFTECGRRADYYRNPVEDAILFALTL